MIIQGETAQYMLDCCDDDFNKHFNEHIQTLKFQ
jgi:hypothetical protein